MIKQNIAKLLESEMDRKDFLKTLGIAVAAFTGATAAIKTVSTQAALLSSSRKASSTETTKLSYGASIYGGVQTETRTLAS